MYMISWPSDFPEWLSFLETYRNLIPWKLAQAALREPPEVALQCVPTFGLSSSFLAQAALRAPPEVALQCVAGHCYYPLSLFLSLSWVKSILLHSKAKILKSSPWSIIFFLFLRLLLLTHFWETPVCENLFPPIICHNQKKSSILDHIYIPSSSIATRSEHF